METMKIDLTFSLPNGTSKSLVFVGSRLALVGPSGCGKSSAAKILAGLIEGSGSFKIGDVDLMKLPAWQRSIGYTPQDLVLMPHLSVKQNLLFPVNAVLKEEVLEALDLTALLDRMPRYLSGGEKQRVALARCLMGNPKILIMDEPFSSLDQKMKERVVTFIHHYTLSQKLNFIFISHDSREIEQLKCETLLF